METLVNSSNIANTFHVRGFERSEKTFPGEFIGIGMFVNGVSPPINRLDFIQDFPRYLTPYMISFFETVFLGNNTVTVCVMFVGKASHGTFEPFVFFDDPDSGIAYVERMNGYLKCSGSSWNITAVFRAIR